MECRHRYPLQALNTFGVPATAACYLRFDAETEILSFLARHPLKDTPRLVLGGGSNLLFVDDFPGTLLHPVFTGIVPLAQDARHVWIRALAGEPWDHLVALCVNNGWFGLENLSLIPGSVGASVVQNIGAYGVEVQSAVERVEAIAIDDRQKVVLSADQCGFGYRTSRFKEAWEGRFVVTAVTFKLNRQPCYVLDYPGVRATVAQLGRVDLKRVRQAIIHIRRNKLPDPAVTGNAGSFFKNPVVDDQTLARLLAAHPDLPHYRQADGRFKLAAGWLIDRCGWKGRRLGKAAVHDRHALVLINRGGATGKEILALAQGIQGAVSGMFGVGLEPEVRVVP